MSNCILKKEQIMITEDDSKDNSNVVVVEYKQWEDAEDEQKRF